MKSRRKRRRKLKKGFKIFFISIPVIAVVVLILIFGFRLQKINYLSDINQFSTAEVKAYIDAKKIDNTLFFWLKNKVGMDEEIDLFEEYSVKMNSPFQVTITAYEKKLKGYMKENETYYYIDENGKVLKKTTEKIKNIPRIMGIEYDKITLYNTLTAKDGNAFSVLLKVINATEEYDFAIKRIKVSKTQEITLYIKKIKVELGKEYNLDKKLNAFNDFYEDAIKYEGTLNMKRLSTDGSYTFEKPEETTESKKANEKKE